MMLHFFIWSLITFMDVTNSRENVSQEICMDNLGCFDIPSDFKHPIRRPKNALPKDRAIINTRFLLYTRKNKKLMEVLSWNDTKSVGTSSLNPQLPTIFIVHGFGQEIRYTSWMDEMKDELLEYKDANVFIVDWSGGNFWPYFQAVANCRVVGAEIASFVKVMEEYTGIKRESVHVIGHSLGAHIAGYAGKLFQGRLLGRLTGLDPAGPYFQGMPPSVRLDSTDADFVDIIHSGGESHINFIGYGTRDLLGHVDFFPNNGRNQPGCMKERLVYLLKAGLMKGFDHISGCNHLRALAFMTTSIKHEISYPVAYKCSSWEDFLDGKCADCGINGEKCSIMGIRAHEYTQYKFSPFRAPFYLRTSSNFPYWLYHFHLTMKLSTNGTSYDDTDGHIKITLIGSVNKVSLLENKKPVDLKHQAYSEYLLTTSTELGDVMGVSLTWLPVSKISFHISDEPTLNVEHIIVMPMNIIEKSPRSLFNRVFCPNPQMPLKPDITMMFKQDNECTFIS